MARDLRTRYIFLELQFPGVEHRSTGLHRLSNETGSIRPRIGGSVSHSFLSVQGEHLEQLANNDFVCSLALHCHTMAAHAIEVFNHSRVCRYRAI